MSADGPLHVQGAGWVPGLAASGGRGPGEAASTRRWAASNRAGGRHGAVLVAANSPWGPVPGSTGHAR